LQKANKPDFAPFEASISKNFLINYPCEFNIAICAFLYGCGKK